MSHGLLVTDRELLCDLYCVNLKAYVTANMTAVETIQEAMKVIEISPSLDFIICQTEIDGKNIVNSLYAASAKGTEPPIPIVFIGKKENIPEGIPCIEDPFDIKAIVREAAKILQITAQDMFKLPVPQLFPMPAHLFAKQEKSTTDAYHRVVKNQSSIEFVKIINSGDSMINRAENFKKEGIKTIYIPSSSRLKIINSTTDTLIKILRDQNSTPNDKAKAAEDGQNLFADLLSHVDEEVKEDLKNLSETCISCVKNVIDSSPTLNKLTELLLNNQSNYIYTHGVMANYICNHIIKHSSWGNKEQVDKMGLVLFYHDIFLVPLYLKKKTLIHERDLLNQNVTPDEKKVIESHAYLAANLVRGLKKIPHGTDSIILQHHGSKNGIGWATGYPDDISTLAKVLMVGETFAEQFLKQMDSKSFDLQGTLDFLKDKFKRGSYRNLVDTLATIKI